jgi:hypothetical protein
MLEKNIDLKKMSMTLRGHVALSKTPLNRTQIFSLTLLDHQQH